MIKAVLFDFFGVIYPDTFWGLANQFLPERTDEQHQLLHDGIKKANLNYITQDDLWVEAAAIFGVEVEQVLTALNKFGGADTVLLEKVALLKQRGIKVGILSNVGTGTISEALGTAVELFDVKVLSGDIGHMKPDLQAYEFALDKLGVAPKECLFFDDIPRNVRGAESAGMHAVHYKGIHDFNRAMMTYSIL